ncbi:MAG: CBS domain-containing protein [bacterium]|nr:CBS domain-containing protein [bacterium]
MKASDIMSRDVITVNPSATVREIADILKERRISGLPVTEGGRVVGVVSEEDIIFRDASLRLPAFIQILDGIIFLGGLQHYEEAVRKMVGMRAADIMTREVISVGPDTPVREIADLMVTRDINRVPVIVDDVLVGIVTRADIVRYASGRSVITD